MYASPDIRILAISDLLKDADDTRSGYLAKLTYTYPPLSTAVESRSRGNDGRGGRGISGFLSATFLADSVSPAEVLAFRGTISLRLVRRFVASPGTPGCSRRRRRGAGVRCTRCTRRDRRGSGRSRSP